MSTPPPLASIIYCILGWLASVGNDTVKHAAHYVAQTTRVPFFFFFSSSFDGRLQLVVELDHLCGVENFCSAQGEWSYHLVF